MQDERCLARSGSVPKARPVRGAAAGVLPSDSSAAVAVPISAQTALGERLPGVGGHGEAMGLAWRRLGVLWNCSGGF